MVERRVMLQPLIGAAALLLLPAAPLLAQQKAPAARISTAATLSFGSYSTGSGGWPRVGFSAHQGIGVFEARVELWSVSRPVVLCSPGLSDAACDQLKGIRGLSLGGRLVGNKGAWHPYVGAGGGPTWYFHRGTMVYGEGGLRVDVVDRLAIELRGALDILADNSELGGARSLSLGARYRILP